MTIWLISCTACDLSAEENLYNESICFIINSVFYFTELSTFLYDYCCEAVFWMFVIATNRICWSFYFYIISICHIFAFCGCAKKVIVDNILYSIKSSSATFLCDIPHWSTTCCWCETDVQFSHINRKVLSAIVREKRAGWTGKTV